VTPFGDSLRAISQVPSKGPLNSGGLSRRAICPQLALMIWAMSFYGLVEYNLDEMKATLVNNRGAW
jgi:hypothetical protein